MQTFQFCFDMVSFSYEIDNLQCVQRVREVDEQINKEICAGRYVGPFIHPSLPDVLVSPLGLVKRKP